MGQSAENELATVAVPRDELDRARIEAPTPRSGSPLPVLDEPVDDEESTRAVPREELMRGQDAHVVVGDDAGGDDATLAVAPGNNEANSKHLAALAQTFQSDGGVEGGFPPPPGGGFPPQPHAPNMGGPMGQHPMNAPQRMGGPPSWNDPQQPPWNGPASPPMQQAMGPTQGRPPSNPDTRGSNPLHNVGHHAHMGQGMAMHGQMPHPMQGQMQGPMSYPGQQMPMMQGQQQPAASPWVLPGPGGKPIKLTGQILLLAIVGVICVAIFITGLVLFATTKF